MRALAVVCVLVLLGTATPIGAVGPGATSESDAEISRVGSIADLFDSWRRDFVSRLRAIADHLPTDVGPNVISQSPFSHLRDAEAEDPSSDGLAVGSMSGFGSDPLYTPRSNDLHGWPYALPTTGESPSP